MEDTYKQEAPTSVRFTTSVKARLAHYIEITDQNRNAAVNDLLDQALTKWEEEQHGMEGRNP